MSSSIFCIICADKISNDQNYPSSLDCGHVFHESCINYWVEAELEEGEDPHCPICQQADCTAKNKLFLTWEEETYDTVNVLKKELDKTKKKLKKALESYNILEREMDELHDRNYNLFEHMDNAIIDLANTKKLAESLRHKLAIKEENIKELNRIISQYNTEKENMLMEFREASKNCDMKANLAKCKEKHNKCQYKTHFSLLKEKINTIINAKNEYDDTAESTSQLNLPPRHLEQVQINIRRFSLCKSKTEEAGPSTSKTNSGCMQRKKRKLN